MQPMYLEILPLVTTVIGLTEMIVVFVSYASFPVEKVWKFT